MLYKYNFVSTMLHRGFMICSSHRTLHFEILKLKQIFRSNGFPKTLVDRCMKMYSRKVFIKRPNICIMPKNQLVCVFPFLDRKPLEIKTRLQNAIERTSPYCKLKVFFRLPSKIVNHFHFKDVLPKKLCSGIVYSFKCDSCNAIYYGKTKRHFYVRAAEHMGILHLTNKRLKNVKQSAISDHLLICDCNMNFDDFTILSKDSNDINWLIKESLLISCDKSISNKTVKCFPLELLEWQILIIVNPRVSYTSNSKIMILSKCTICSSKKLRFVKNQEDRRRLHFQWVQLC